MFELGFLPLIGDIASSTEAKGIEKLTNSYWVFNVLYLYDIAQEDAALFGPFTIFVIIIVKDDTRRVDDFQSALYLDGSQVFRMAWLGGDAADLCEAGKR